MMKVKIMLDEGAKVSRGHDTDAGLDLHSRETKVVPARGCAVFDTGVHIELPKVSIGNGYMTYDFYTDGEIVSKSGLNVKHNLVSFGEIDYGYSGAMVVKLYNLGDEDYTVHKGDKISQLVIRPIIIPELEVVDHFEETERGNGGFGSTGR